ncbi:ankyrin repeat domain-containing protein [archaeon]|nr:MAG: ankyrin repeat domain-containing protein [archaeon]
MNDPTTSSFNDQLSLFIDRDASYHELCMWMRELEMMGVRDVSKVINYSDLQHPIDELTAMLQAAEKGNLDIVRCLVHHGGDVDLSRINLGLTAFAWACYRDHLPVVKYLVENCSVNVNAHTPAGRTGLLWACRRGNLDMVRFLVEVAHVNVYHKENNLISPLLLISSLAHVDEAKYLRIIQYLVRICGVNVNEQDVNGYTALINARYVMPYISIL